MKIPFWIKSLNKGYSQSEYQIEKIKYYYEGIDAELKINSVKYAPETFENEFYENEIKFKYNKINAIEYSWYKSSILRKYNKISETEFKLALLKRNLDYGEITPYQYALAEADFTITDEKKLSLKKNEIEFLYGNKSKYDYELEKINLTFPSNTSKDYKLAVLNLKRENNKILNYEYDIELVDLSYNKDSLEWKLKILDVEKKYDKITENQYEKNHCSIIGEPYFSIISEKYDDGKIEFELDWNDIFIKKLKDEGMVGYTEQQMVDQYFKEICKQIAEEEEIFDYQEQFGPTIEREDKKEGIYYS